MKGIPSNPLDRFYYYIDAASETTQKYRKKAEDIQKEKLDYNVYADREYKKITEENRDNTLDTIRRNQGTYTDNTQGFNNSWLTETNQQVRERESLSNEAAREAMTNARQAEFQKEKEQKLLRLKRKYAREYGNQMYQVNKANEDYLFQQAGYGV